MQTYSEYAPTGFDTKGLNLDDQQDWLVFLGQNRDSGCLDQSNYACAMAALDESDPDWNDHEDHRFGHWACGWLEIIIVRPDSKCAAIAASVSDALADYPVLDEEDYSQREWDQMSEYWRSMNTADRVDCCQKSGGSIFAARYDHIPSDWDHNDWLRAD